MTALDFTDYSAPYVTGHSFALRCARYFAWGGLGEVPGRNNDAIYCKTDDVHKFFASGLVPADPFVLLTHNSDYPVDDRYLPYLDDPRVRLWLAANPAVEHPKLKALPLGIADHHFEHGNVNLIDKVRAESNPKSTLLYANYSLHTNRTERAKCAEMTGVPIAGFKHFEAFLRELSGAMFCIAPAGNGIDTHRVWEALYLGTIPVVTRNLITRDHADLPMIVLDDWSEFRKVPFSPELYRETWGAFDPAALTMDGYCARLKERYGVSL